MVRDYSTGGGHLPGDELVEGDEQIVTRKWQGYPPVNLNVVGKSFAPLLEIAIPRYTGTALYAPRVMLPNMLYAKVIQSPHPRARVRRIDVSRAERIPGVAYILNLSESNYRPVLTVIKSVYLFRSVSESFGLLHRHFDQKSVVRRSL